MTNEVRFIARISKVRGNMYGITIPEQVMKKKGDLIRKWHENGELLIIEIKELDGTVRQ